MLHLVQLRIYTPKYYIKKDEKYGVLYVYTLHYHSVFLSTRIILINERQLCM
jgi:hypothetical protein